MEILKIKSPHTTRYGFVLWKKNNQWFFDLHIGKTCWMMAFMKVAK